MCVNCVANVAGVIIGVSGDIVRIIVVDVMNVIVVMCHWCCC